MIVIKTEHFDVMYVIWKLETFCCSSENINIFTGCLNFVYFKKFSLAHFFCTIRIAHANVTRVRCCMTRGSCNCFFENYQKKTSACNQLFHTLFFESGLATIIKADDHVMIRHDHDDSMLLDMIMTTLIIFYEINFKRTWGSEKFFD